MIEPELIPPFEVLEPAGIPGPLVFDTPHSGRTYPSRFVGQSRLDPLTLRRSEDAFVDDLVQGVVARGTPLIRALFPRAFLDVNREPFELDPRMFEGRLPGYVNTRSLRVAGGLGTIARIVGDGQDIYSDRLPVEEGLRRVEGLYKPYHRALRKLLNRAHRFCGIAVLIDCHSMPSSSLDRDERPKADIVLGDRYGVSCSPIITDAVDATLRRLGYQISRNKPYAGGYITETYGNPSGGFHALQIEINRALYMDERRITPLPGFERLARDLMTVHDALMDLPFATVAGYDQAAE